MVLNLASEGEIRPTHAWKMQNSITRTPISCKSKEKGFNIQTTSKKFHVSDYTASLLFTVEVVPDNHKQLWTRLSQQKQMQQSDNPLWRLTVAHQ